MRILILGSGAREHALVRALLRDAADHDVLVAPGNAGIAELVPVVPVDAADTEAVAALALERHVDLVVVGPEAPLVAGVADALRARGVPVFGPDRAAARLEGSKAFAKRIMAEAGVPSGRAVDVRTLAELDAGLAATGSPFVVKADGLAAGKGVLVTTDASAARAHAERWLEQGPVLLEEFLPGREVSLFFVCDGQRALPLSPAQDAKRLGDGDAGPNTGGMGAYSPLPWLAEVFGDEAAFTERVRRTVAQPVLDRLAALDTPFIGLLYCGLVVDGGSVKVIEFNVRFGDPETQVVLPRLETPLGDLLLAAAGGLLTEEHAPRFADRAAVGVVLASEGYPDAPLTGRRITGLAAAAAIDGTQVEHAATADSPDGIVTAGGRVLTVVGVGADLVEARARAYRALEQIRFTGEQHRTDIAAGVA